jgi:hypothetical protein
MQSSTRCPAVPFVVQVQSRIRQALFFGLVCLSCCAVAGNPAVAAPGDPTSGHPDILIVARFPTDDGPPIMLVARCIIINFRDVAAEVVISDLHGGPVAAFGFVEAGSPLLDLVADDESFTLIVDLDFGLAGLTDAATGDVRGGEVITFRYPDPRVN